MLSQVAKLTGRTVASVHTAAYNSRQLSSWIEQEQRGLLEKSYLSDLTDSPNILRHSE